MDNGTRALLDTAAITAVLTDYCRYLDRMDLEALGALFTIDCRVIYGPDPRLAAVAISSPRTTGAHARRGAGHDDVARGQFEIVRQVGNHLLHLPDHLVQVAGLLGLAVDLHLHKARGRVAHGRHGLQLAHRRRQFERLADFPRTAHFLGDALQVAARHVQAHAIAPDVIQRLVDWDVLATRLQRHDQLDLVVHVLGLFGVGEGVAEIQVVGVLLEEEGRLAIRVMAHFDRMRGIVAADAVDAAHREPSLVPE
jgi:hypothetical protein